MYGLLHSTCMLYHKKKATKKTILETTTQTKVTTLLYTMMIAPLLQTSINYKPNMVEKIPLYNEPIKTTANKKLRGSIDKGNLIRANGITSNVRQRSSSTSYYITNPTQYDVLCIKDKTWARHSGNRIYRERVLTLASQYDNASKQDKMKITRSIVSLMQNKYNSRFLRQITNSNQNNQNQDQNDLWEVITDKQARDKTSHALRFAAKTTTRTPTPSSSTRNSSNTTTATASISSMTLPTPIPIMSNSNSDTEYYCEQSIVSTSSTYDHTKQKRNDDTVDEEEDDEHDDEEPIESLQKVVDNEVDSDAQQILSLSKENDHWKDDSFLLKCENIVEITNLSTNDFNNSHLSQKELNSNMTNQDYDYDTTLYNKQQKPLLQSMAQQQQQQYQYDDNDDESITDNHNMLLCGIPEPQQPVRALSFQRWTSVGSIIVDDDDNNETTMKNHRYGTTTNDTTNMFLDMSLSLDDIFSSYPYYDTTTLNSSKTGATGGDAGASTSTAAITSGTTTIDHGHSFNPKDYDDLQLNF